jgi:glutamate formiminotransferase/formiminotetrahydrofolate cyclodeaminase
MGALDVCPFIPVANTTMEECVELAKIFGKRCAEELNVPIFLYGEAAQEEKRRKLPNIRAGEYEGMAQKIYDPEWKPDFGPAEFVPSWGASATGARFFLIAYNVNIIGTNNQAHRIALDLRTNGRGPGEPGLLDEVQGMGWWVDEYNMAQITMNLTNYKVTPIHVAFEEAKRLASEINVAVAGSELVGLVPLEAMLQAADYYMEKENLFIIDEEQKIRLVIERLGLNSVGHFDPKKRIIEYLIQEDRNEPLASMSVRAFTEEVAARTSAPGGGSVSAAIAALGTGLGAMVAKLTYGVRKFENIETELRGIIPTLHNATQDLIPMIDADTNAFNDYVDAMRLPKGNEAEQKLRNEAMQNGLKKAILVPLTTMRNGDKAWDKMVEVAKFGNIASKSDVEVGARALEVGIWGAYKNVLINMPGIQDEAFKAEILKEAEDMKIRAEIKCKEVLDILSSRDK